jgi:hypothetical protein
VFAQAELGVLHLLVPYGLQCGEGVLRKQQVDLQAQQKHDENRPELEYTQQHEHQNCLWELASFQLESLINNVNQSPQDIWFNPNYGA